MCGIAGLVSFEAPPSKRLVKAMTLSQALKKNDLTLTVPAPVK